MSELHDYVRNYYPDMFSGMFSDKPKSLLGDPPMTATSVRIAMEAAQKELAKYKPKADFMTDEPSAETMIAMRLRVRNGMALPFKHMTAYRDDKLAIVTVVTMQGKPVLIEDDAGLFPSDTLITQLRMLVETGNIKGGVIGAVSGG